MGALFFFAILLTIFASRPLGRIAFWILVPVLVGAVALELTRDDASALAIARGASIVPIVLIPILVIDTIVPAWRWMRRARVAPLVLTAPFRGRWIVAAGGPLRAFNHHQIASDQFFAYDFIRRDAPSLGSEILAPLDGMVVAMHDGMPDRPPSRSPDHPSITIDTALGNYVAIEREGDRGVVFLCHLQNGSVTVKRGDRVAVGDVVGRCGNSGRTTQPHLHLHAQDLPEYAFNRARGVPIRFQTAEARSRTLHFRSLLVGDR